VGVVAPADRVRFGLVNYRAIRPAAAGRAAGVLVGKVRAVRGQDVERVPELRVGDDVSVPERLLLAVFVMRVRGWRWLQCLAGGSGKTARASVCDDY
jgi:hypothetical protein